MEQLALFADGWQPSPSIVPDSYPHSPGYKGERDGPSERAAKVIALTVTGRRAEVLSYLRTRAAGPETADEIATGLNRSILSIRPRVAELHAMGMVEAVAQRGRNESGMTAHRWKAVQL